MAMNDTTRMFAGMLDASHGMSLEAIPGLVHEQAAHGGLGNAAIYLADLQQEVLRLLTGQGTNAGEGADGSCPSCGSTERWPGRAFQDWVRVLPKPGADAGGVDWWWVPLLDGTERLGVLRVKSGRAADERTQENIRHLASMVALLVVSRAQSQRLLRPAGQDPVDGRARGDAVEPPAAAVPSPTRRW